MGSSFVVGIEVDYIQIPDPPQLASALPARAPRLDPMRNAPQAKDFRTRGGPHFRTSCARIRRSLAQTLLRTDEGAPHGLLRFGPGSMPVTPLRHLGAVVRGCALVSLPPFLMLACTAKAPPPPPPAGIKAAIVLQRDVPIYLEAIGQTRGNTETEILARVEGYVASGVEQGATLVTGGKRPEGFKKGRGVRV